MSNQKTGLIRIIEPTLALAQDRSLDHLLLLLLTTHIHQTLTLPIGRCLTLIWLPLTPCTSPFILLLIIQVQPPLLHHHLTLLIRLITRERAESHSTLRLLLTMLLETQLERSLNSLIGPSPSSKQFEL